MSLDMMLALETLFGMVPDGLLFLGRRMKHTPGSRMLIYSM